MNIHIETDRLILRDLELTDAEGIFKLDSDPEVHEFLGNQTISSLDEAIQIIEHVRGQYEKNGMGRWAIIDKSTGDFIGWTGLKYEEAVRTDFSYYDLGYRLRKKYWGKGIATETALESLKYGFTKLGLIEIGAAAHIDHVVSNKILKKIGLSHVDRFECDGELHNWYNITREEWMGIR